MSRQTAASLACARAFRRSVRDGIFHRHVKRVVVAVRLRVLQRTLVFYSPRRHIKSDQTAQRKEEKKRTALKPLEPLLHVLFVALALLELFDLYLLANLLAFALAPPRLTLRDGCALVEQTLSDAFHVRIRLDHFCEKVVRSREGEAMFCGEGASGLRSMQSLFVATKVRTVSQLA